VIVGKRDLSYLDLPGSGIAGIEACRALANEGEEVSMASKKRQEKPVNSLFAGALAGAVEGFVTYPTEFVKVRQE
jgi:aspartate oxidase